MQTLRRITQPVNVFVVIALTALILPLPAQAALVSTERLVQAQQAQSERERLATSLNREDVKQQLLAYGVKPVDVQARVDGLTDQEVQTLAAQMDTLPAGGTDPLGLAVFVFLVLLLTDILGYTDIFPFVVKQHRR
jgi:hypothetical protein